MRYIKLIRKVGPIGVQEETGRGRKDALKGSQSGREIKWKMSSAAMRDVEGVFAITESMRNMVATLEKEELLQKVKMG